MNQPAKQGVDNKNLIHMFNIHLRFIRGKKLFYYTWMCVIYLYKYIRVVIEYSEELKRNWHTLQNNQWIICIIIIFYIDYNLSDTDLWWNFIVFSKHFSFFLWNTNISLWFRQKKLTNCDQPWLFFSVHILFSLKQEKYTFMMMRRKKNSF